MQDKYRAIKTGEYNLEKEEVQLTELLKEMARDPRKANNKFKDIGLLNYTMNNSVDATKLDHHNLTTSLRDELST